jgi:hypothetical protein
MLHILSADNAGKSCFFWSLGSMESHWSYVGDLPSFQMSSPGITEIGDGDSVWFVGGKHNRIGEISWIFAERLPY